MGKLSARTLTGLIVVGTTSGMAVPLVIWFLRDPEKFAADLLGITQHLLHIPWVWVLAGLVTVSYIAYTFWAVPFVREHAGEVSLLKFLAIPLALVTGTLEELIFRKLLMDWLDDLGFAIVLQIVATALAFGLAHSVWALFSRDVSVILPVVAATTILGGLLGTTYLLGGRLVLPVIVAHVVINFLIEPWLLLSSVEGKWKNASARMLSPTP